MLVSSGISSKIGSLGMTITVSAVSFSIPIVFSARFIRLLPSKLKGKPTKHIVRAPFSLAFWTKVMAACELNTSAASQVITQSFASSTNTDNSSPDRSMAFFIFCFCDALSKLLSIGIKNVSNASCFLTGLKTLKSKCTPKISVALKELG